VRTLALFPTKTCPEPAVALSQVLGPGATLVHKANRASLSKNRAF
jgi:hypothetical protein